MLKADGFDEAVLGIGIRATQEDVIVYDAQKCMDIIKRDSDDSSDFEALEYFEYNVAGAWHGEQTPIFLYKKTMKEIDEDLANE
tara:strand:- start:207 stop:458 length:252 start_codon:yes stop_codon:yes gene_type:complete